MVGAEPRDVIDEGLSAGPVPGSRLDPYPVESRHPSLIEDGVHRDDALEFARQRVEMLGSEHPGGAGGLEGIRGDRVPASEHDIVESGQVDELGNRQGLAVARVNTAELTERSDRRAESVAGSEDAGDEGGADGAESGEEGVFRLVLLD